MIVHVWVHPVDRERFPSVPPGFRWCVGLTDDPSDPGGWLNAGWAPTVNEAELDGVTVGVTVAKGFCAIGNRAHYEVHHLDTDPCTRDLITFA